MTHIPKHADFLPNFAKSFARTVIIKQLKGRLKGGDVKTKNHDMRRIKMYSLDFLMYAQEIRLEEDELMEEGYIDDYERLSVAEIKRRYEEYLRDMVNE